MKRRFLLGFIIGFSILIISLLINSRLRIPCIPGEFIEVEQPNGVCKEGQNWKTHIDMDYFTSKFYETLDRQWIDSCLTIARNEISNCGDTLGCYIYFRQPFYHAGEYNGLAMITEAADENTIELFTNGRNKKAVVAYMKAKAAESNRDFESARMYYTNALNYYTEIIDRLSLLKTANLKDNLHNAIDCLTVYDLLRDYLFLYGKTHTITELQQEIDSLNKLITYDCFHLSDCDIKYWPYFGSYFSPLEI